jgi:hypothetical protein
MSEWISVKDRLPAKNQKVLASWAGEYVAELIYAYSETSPRAYKNGPRWEWQGRSVPMWNITHWMPLPEPPKENP